MTSNKFKDEMDSFIFDLLDSKLYKNYLQCKKKMEEDEDLKKLSEKRSNLFLKAHEENDENKKREYLLEFSKLTDEIKGSQLYIDYFNSYKKVKDILSIINEGIISKIK